MSNPVYDDVTGKRNRQRTAERELSNQRAFEAAQAQFGDQGGERLLLNSEGFYYLPQSANPRRRMPEGETGWAGAFVGPGPGIADTQAIRQARNILGETSGLPEADFYDAAMNRSRVAQGKGRLETRQDRMQDTFARAMRALG